MKEPSKEYLETLAKMLAVKPSQAGDYQSMIAYVAACRAALGTDEQIEAMTFFDKDGKPFKLNIKAPYYSYDVVVGFAVLDERSTVYTFAYIVENFKELTNEANNKN